MSRLDRLAPPPQPAGAAANGHTGAAAAAPVAPVDAASAAALHARLRSTGLKRLLHAREALYDRDADEDDLKRARLPAVFNGSTSLDLLSKGNKGGVGSSASKRKYLMHLPFQFSCKATHAQIGSIAHMNTRNPVMYLQFPMGCVKLFGTLIPTSNTYLAVQYSQSKRQATTAAHHGPLQVKGTFDRILAFTEWRWIGKLEDNPEEKELPIPAELSVAPRKHAPLPMGGTGSQQDDDAAAMTDGGGSTAGTPSKRKRAPAKTRRLGGGSSEDEEDGDEDDEEPVLDDEDSDRDELATPKRKPRKTAAASASKGSGAGSAKKKRRVVTSSDESSAEEDEEEGGDDDDDEEEPAPRKSSSAAAAAATVSRPRRASTGKVSYAEKAEEEEEEEEQSEEEDVEVEEEPEGEEEEGEGEEPAEGEEEAEAAEEEEEAVSIQEISD